MQSFRILQKRHWKKIHKERQNIWRITQETFIVKMNIGGDLIALYGYLVFPMSLMRVIINMKTFFVGLLKKNKRWLSGKGSDDEDSDSDDGGILANLAAEDEELPEEMRKEAVDKLEAELREAEAEAKK